MKVNWIKKECPADIEHYECEDRLLSVTIERNKLFGLHLAIYHKYRNPSWEEIHSAITTLLPPELNYAVYLPEGAKHIGTNYTDTYQHCFHIYEASSLINAGIDRVSGL